MKLTREDMREYPPTAIREALLNAVVHREYAFSGSTLDIAGKNPRRTTQRLHQ